MKINRQKIISAIVLIIVSAIFCLDTLYNHGFTSFITHLSHCSCVGIVVLMFSRELRGDGRR